ncbi:MAG: GntR family transcriptional regulator [Synergistaceae bacterium]|nr:GntR family transcriptional regulator [Synergistaceae bacterium]
MLNIKPVKLMPVREQAASSLREAIITRNLKEGEILTLEATAKALGISATPVREAFQILARDGLIELAQNRGAVVLGFNENTIRQHYEIRAALESVSCRLVCEKEAPLEGIEHCIIQAREVLSSNPEKYPDYNQSFHYNIWLASGNIRMLNMLSELWNGLSLGLKTTRAEYFTNSHAEHENIFARLKERDSHGAYEAMYAHIVRSMNDILTRYV